MTASRIFITGGTGFIGSHVVSDALKAGHHLLLSVRRDAQADEITARFSEYASQLEFVTIPDIGDKEAIHAALANKDITYILHIASPMPGKGEDFKTEYLAPAVQGTEAILNVANTTPSIKRVVIVSSILSLMPLGGMTTPGLEVKTGTNLSLLADEDMPFPPGRPGHGLKYSASKILAHRATINWMTANKPHFSLVTVHPTYVLGRDFLQKDANSPNGINAYLMQSFTNPPEGKPTIVASFVDVRDVSQVVLKSMDVELDGKELLTEYLAVGKKTGWDEVVRFVKEKYPEVEMKLEGPYEPGFVADTGRTERELGIEWRGMEEIIGSVLDQQRELRV
ncbi:putative reductase [Podospora fimiseda]|uniref:Reductase n=1 Tax=Podospora fimiseda TaxID=252190 RepID=A0AAN7GWN8_9PEZI|nr:putative reductase [Podospora fimiseda]